MPCTSIMWGDFHYVITGKKPDSSVTFEGGWQNNRRLGMHDQIRFVDNILEELDAPGEWFLDNKSHTLYYFPAAGVDLGKAVVEGVRLRHLVEFRGGEGGRSRLSRSRASSSATRRERSWKTASRSYGATGRSTAAARSSSTAPSTARSKTARSTGWAVTPSS